MKNLLYILPLLFVLSACEDVIEVDNGFQSSQLVIDAWLDNMQRTQTVRLSNSQDYFNDAFAQAVTGATVTLSIDGKGDISFEDQQNGNYTWSPTAADEIGIVGDQYTLRIELEGQTYIAQTAMNRVPQIDSIAQIYEEKQLGIPEGNYAELFATDFSGQGDTYWVKTWKNGELLNKPIEILLIYDATFDSGNDLDGIQFIFPLRRAINPIPDEFDDDGPPPYEPGDSIYVEIHSISNEAFDFWAVAREQMTNGENGIYALPLANTRSNITNEATGTRVLGFFNVSAVESASKMIE
jgi:hypothetical protein